MRSLISALLLTALPGFSGGLSYYAADTAGGWPVVLSSIGLVKAAEANADVIVAPARIRDGTIVILEGESALAASLGFRPGSSRVTVRSVEDVHAPKLRIVWEKALDVPVFEIPKEARVFAKERWQGAPLMAGMRRGAGAVVWVAAQPGPQGYERFPYIAQALADLGFEPSLRSAGLWAFFDASYRARADLDYFAPLWRRAGIRALHVAAWHNWERDPESDDYMRRLIDACHRNGIQVYAWIELPHVSERFWLEHPEWREKTALLQDAQLDWRKLMNLTNREAFRAVAAGLSELVNRFDWDGVNLAELYFESLEGPENPARFTPMNADVRAEFKAQSGVDPLDLFSGAAITGLPRFLEYRAELARRQQAEWIAEIERARRTRPHLDLVLTHIDDRFDPSMTAKLGADALRTLPLLAQHDFTFLVEDPATIWNLGPQRYLQIAARYKPITPRPEKLAIDINIVERYQDVYPTKQPTGAELYALVHTAAAAFPRLALYFESSLAPVDLPWLSAAASVVDRAETAGGTMIVESRRAVGVDWRGPAVVDGRPWPVADDRTLWLAPGAHSVVSAAAGAAKVPLRLMDLNAELKSAAATATGIEFVYESNARALARFDRAVRRLEIDGVEARPQMIGDVLLLPRGQHFVAAIPAPDTQTGQ